MYNIKYLLTITQKADIINADATVAQSVEQLIRNQQAAGSSPASSSIDGSAFCSTTKGTFLISDFLDDQASSGDGLEL